MLKNITLSAEDLVIKKAREKARNEKKTLNALFREWLAQYTRNTNLEYEFDQFMERTGYVNPGKKFTREELNARILYTEDLNDGQKIKGVHIVNPFKEHL